MAKYATHVSQKSTPQQEAITGKVQVQNNEGGYVFEIDGWARLRRFLILGAEGGTYYATERKLTIENAKCVSDLIAEDGFRVVNTALMVSEHGHAPKNTPAVFVLALCASCSNPEVKKLALSVMPRICRTGTDLFAFTEAVNTLRGWGPGLCRGVAKWYTEKTPFNLAFQLTKYAQRDGWSHKDVLSLCHPRTWSNARANILKRINPKLKYETAKFDNAPLDGLAEHYLDTVEQIQKVTTAKEAAKLIRDLGLPREVVPSQFLTDPDIWSALLERMPPTALVRNLGNLSKCGLLVPMSEADTIVMEKLGNVDELRKSRMHPMTVLIALKQYGQGHGLKGGGTWNPSNRVLGALDNAYMICFGNIEPANKRTLLALDVSGSMGGAVIAGSTLTAREGAAAMAMVFARTEPSYAVMAFMHEFVALPITARDSISDVIGKTSDLPFGGTQCDLPMLFALKHKMAVDTFVVLTDSETHHGEMHPCQALRQYREKTGINARLAVVGMTATKFSIADPADAGSMDFVGFDGAAPNILNDFSSGRL